ncbi:MAG: putative transcriptional regulator containing HTH and 4VR domain [Candidatus Methanohalarchaeum thermophilum]|uniref:Transcriptional regulator containing HTH and 4VR domain n=1 Tax=Methanohalarchaeum thermophilum TaxID=1903181 RepID=A0A1Q6DXD6_METT1|nr:MAG: putative transcriptional regulator containing HTH and 4VR domain [Candidatus Methanohalarchaeum thermophilum]
MEIKKVLEKLWEHEPKLWNGSEEVSRKELGDNVDYFSLRQIQSSILLFDPSFLPKNYSIIKSIVGDSSKKWISKRGLSNFYEEEFKELEKYEKEDLIKSIFEEHQNEIFKRFGLGSIDITEIQENQIKIRVDECVEAYKSSNIGHPICYNVTGILAGEINARFDGWDCFEKSCLANGDSYCEFILAPQEHIIRQIRSFLDLPTRGSLTLRGEITNMLSESARKKDYSPILEEMANYVLYLMKDLKSYTRPQLGTKINIKTLQQFYLAFFIEDFERGSEILYGAGFEQGKRLGKMLSGIGFEEEMSLRNILEKLYERLGLGLLRFRETETGYRAEVKECALCSGLDLDKKICFFNSGFFAGIVSTMENEKYHGSEEMCLGVPSNDLCIHKITPVSKKQREKEEEETQEEEETEEKEKDKKGGNKKLDEN